MTEHADQWRARHAAMIADKGEVPEEAKRIALELPLAGQKVILETAPWALALNRIAEMQLDLFDLLDNDRSSLSDLGLWVFRCLARWNADMTARQRKFDAWIERCYDPRYWAKHPEHAMYRAAFWLPDDQWLLTRFIAAKGTVKIDSAHHASIATRMQQGGLVEIKQTGRTMMARITKFGRSIAAILEREEDARWRIFDGGIPTAYWLDEQRIGNALYRRAISWAQYAIRKAEAARR